MQEEREAGMKYRFVLDLAPGSRDRYGPVYREDFDEHVAVLKRAINYKPLSGDFTNLIDIKSIIEGIQNQLPRRS